MNQCGIITDLGLLRATVRKDSNYPGIDIRLERGSQNILLLEAGLLCSCDLDWPELKTIFHGVRDIVGFEVACAVAQLAFVPSEGERSSQPPVFHLALDDLRCNELYRIEYGEVKRMYGVNPLRIQVYYREQDNKTVDTVEFDCPPGMTAQELEQAIAAFMKEMPMTEDEDRLSHMEDVLTCAACKLHATWAYLPIAKCVEVE